MAGPYEDRIRLLRKRMQRQFPNGPRPKPTRGRNRNTVANNKSKRTGGSGGGSAPQYKTVQGSALLRPTEVVSLNQQLQGLETGKADALATLALERAQVRSGFINAREDIRSQRQEGMQAAQMDAAERGMEGSTVAWHNRMGVKEDAATALARAQAERDQSLAANLLARLQTRRDYILGTQNVSALKAAMQAEANTERYANDMVMGLGVASPPAPTAADYGLGGGGGGQGGAGLTGNQADKYAGYTNTINTLLGRLKDMPVTMPDGTPNKGRAAILKRLYDIWDQRNALMVSGGLNPYRRRILNRRVKRIGG